VKPEHDTAHTLSVGWVVAFVMLSFCVAVGYAIEHGPISYPIAIWLAYWGGGLLSGRFCEWLVRTTFDINRRQIDPSLWTSGFLIWPVTLSVAVVAAPTAALLRSIFRRPPN